MADDKDLAAKKAALDHPLFLPEEFKEYLADFALRVSSDAFAQDIQGLRGARWRSASPKVDPAACNVTSGYGDCVDGEGPVLTGLSDGTWMFVWGFAALDAFTHSTVIFINDDYADGRGKPGGHDDNELFTTQGGSTMGTAVWTIDSHTPSPGTPAGGFPAAPLGNGSNNNKAAVKYFVSSAGARFEKRWLHAIRIDEITKDTRVL